MPRSRAKTLVVVILSTTILIGLLESWKLAAIVLVGWVLFINLVGLMAGGARR